MENCGYLCSPNRSKRPRRRSSVRQKRDHRHIGKVEYSGVFVSFRRDGCFGVALKVIE